MIAVEESRDVEIGADVLDHHVRRVAPAADGDVAVRQRETFERGLIRASHDLDAGARGVARVRRYRTPWRARDPAAPGSRSSAGLPRIDRRAAIAARPSRRYRCRATSRSPARSAGSSRRSDRAARPRRLAVFGGAARGGWRDSLPQSVRATAGRRWMRERPGLRGGS